MTCSRKKVISLLTSTEFQPLLGNEVNTFDMFCYHILRSRVKVMLFEYALLYLRGRIAVCLNQIPAANLAGIIIFFEQQTYL